MYILNIEFVKAGIGNKLRQNNSHFSQPLHSTHKVTMEEPTAPPGSVKKKQKELNNNERLEIVATLLGKCSSKALFPSDFNEMAKIFDVSPRTVRRLWQHCPQSRLKGRVVWEEVKKKDENRGLNNKKWDEKELLKLSKRFLTKTGRPGMPCQSSWVFRSRRHDKHHGGGPNDKGNTENIPPNTH